MKKNLLTLFLTTLLCFGIVEMALNVWHLAPTVHRLRAEINSVNQSAFEGVYQASPNPILFFEPKPLSGVFNEFGIRGKPIPKEKNKKRIFLVGDSVGYGINVPYEKTFASLMQEKMGPAYEIFNFSVPGYDIRQYVEVMKTKILAHSPDFVIFAICMNDFTGPTVEFDLMESQFSGKVYFYSQWQQWLYLKSNTFRLGHFLLSPLFQSFPGPPSKKRVPTEEDIKDLLEEVRTLAHRHSFRYQFIFLPQGAGEIKHTRVFEEFSPVFLKGKIPFYNLNELAYSQFPPEELKKHFLSNDHFHYGPIGHRYVADFLMKNWNLLFPPPSKNL